MKKLLLLLSLYTITTIGLAQTSTPVSPLVQSTLVNAELILPNSVLTNPDYMFFPAEYELTKQRGCYLIKAAEMQAAGFVNGDEINSLAWTISQGQQIQTSGAFELSILNTTDVANTYFPNSYPIYSSTLTIPTQPGQMTFQFETPFTYEGAGIYVYFDFLTNGYSSFSTILQTAVNTNLTEGYRWKVNLGGVWAGSSFSETHSNRPVTVLGKVSCPFAGYYYSISSTDNSTTLTFDTSGNFEIEYGIQPYQQGSGGTIIPQAVISTNANTYVINNLLPGTIYDVYIRRKCNPSSSGYWKKGAFATSISTPVTTLPYIEPFSYNLIATGWTNTSSLNANWGVFNGGYLGMTDVQTAQNNKTTYSRAIQLNAGINYTLTFDYWYLWNAPWIPDSANNPDLNVLLSNSLTSENPTVLSFFNNLSNTTSQLATVTFTPSTSGLYYIGFNGIFGSNPTQDPSWVGYMGFNYLNIDNFKLDTTLGTDNHNVSTFVVFPNPTKEVLNFTQPLKHIQIYDLEGRRLKSINEFQYKIDISELAKGNYIIQGQKETGEKVTRKFIKN